MPEISRFFGVVIYMFWEVGEQHHTPHIHARYQEHHAAFSIVDPIECVAGALPRKPHRLVLAWIEVHRDELFENWQKMQNFEPPDRIPPLS